jgi:hypothetical protein
MPFQYVSPESRGRADSYYGRNRRPHYFDAMGDRVESDRMTENEILAYNEGYDEAESERFCKDWGHD